MLTLSKWKIHEEELVQKTRIFSLFQMRSSSTSTSEKEGTFVYLDLPNWVNVIAITPEQELILVEQYRHGSRSVTLEIPGGMCDEGEDYVVAGLRELKEETGYSGGKAQCIGEVDPNPAFQNNRCGTILVKDVVQICEPQLDPMEEILIHKVPLSEIPELIQNGTIRNALVLAALQFLRFYF